MALVDAKPLVAWPEIVQGLQFLYGSSSTTLNDTTDKISCVFQWPVGGTVTDIAFSTGSVTDTDDVIVRLETLDTSGNPSGTLYVANANGTVTVASTDDNVIKSCQINSGTGVSVTRGDPCALVLALTNSSKTQALLRFRSTALGSVYVPDYNISSAAAWTRSNGSPCVAVKIDGTWYRPSGCWFPITGAGAQTENVQSPKERGARIYMPFAARARGAVFFVTTTAATSYQALLYSGPEAATPTVIASSYIWDSDAVGGTAGDKLLYFAFTASVELAASTAYALVLAPQGAVNLGYYYHSVDTTYAAAHRGGAEFYQYARDTTGATAFTPTTTKCPLGSILLDQIHDGTGGGGLLVHSGMTGGARG